MRAAVALALAGLLLPGVASAHPHMWIAQTVRTIATDGKYTQVEIEWRFDPESSEDEIPAIDEDKDGKISPKELELLARDTMASLEKFGFQTWLNTGGVPVEAVLELGRGVDASPAQFDMTAFSLRLTCVANAVSELHAETANATGHRPNPGRMNRPGRARTRAHNKSSPSSGTWFP